MLTKKTTITYKTVYYVIVVFFYTSPYKSTTCIFSKIVAKLAILNISSTCFVRLPVQFSNIVNFERSAGKDKNTNAPRTFKILKLKKINYLENYLAKLVKGWRLT